MGVAFAFAGLAALHAVFPSLKRARTRRQAYSGLIFFGHMRNRGVASIRHALMQLDDDAMLGQLASQLEATSKIAWNKHARLQRSHILLALAIILFALAETWH